MVTRCRALCYFISNFIGLVVSASAVAALTSLNNSLALSWAIVGFFLALANVHIHLLFLRGRLEDFYNINILIGIKNFGFVLAVTSGGFFLYDIFWMCYYQIPISEPIEQNHVMIAVQIFLTIKYAFLLFVGSDMYISELTTRSLLEI